jgi:AcrR family transcriptional regulator
MHRTESTAVVARRRQAASERTRRTAPPRMSRGRLPMIERRKQLLEAAVRVFAERGFRGATTREIAVAAGVTEAVIFQHFPDKDALYAAILELKSREHQAHQWIADMQARADAGDTSGVLRMLFEGILRQHERDPYVLRLMVYSALEQHPLAQRMQAQSMRLYQFLERLIIDGQRTGRFRQGPPAVLVRAILALPIYYVMQRRLFGAPWPPASPDDLIDSGVQFALAGLERTKEDS